MDNDITYTVNQAEQLSLLEVYTNVSTTATHNTEQHIIVNKCKEIISSLVQRVPHLWYKIQTQINEPGAQGIIHIRNLPAVPHSKIISILISYLLGNVIKYEGEGDYVIDIKAELVKNTDRPSFKNSRVFGPHTDLSYVVEPPPFFILHSIYNDASQGGLTTWCNICGVLSLLSATTIDQLSKPQFIFPAPAHFRGTSSTTFPILTINNNIHHIRFRRDGLQAKTYIGMVAVAELSRAIDGLTEEISLEANSALLIDNRKCLHGRTAFLNTATPRLLHRVYITHSI